MIAEQRRKEAEEHQRLRHERSATHQNANLRETYQDVGTGGDVSDENMSNDSNTVEDNDGQIEQFDEDHSPQGHLYNEEMQDETEHDDYNRNNP